jgi:anti-anti-sigma factor
MLLTINEVSDGDWLSDGEHQGYRIHTARIAGTIDEYTVAQLRELSEIVFDEKRFAEGDHFIINLLEVTEIDHLGLSAMVGIIVALAAKAGTIGVVAQEHHPVRRAFRVTGLDRVFDIHESADDAEKVIFALPQT